MSAQYDNNLSGALFRNNEKREGKQDADYRGSCEINGVQYWIDSWLNESKAGVKYMKLKFKPKLVGEVKGGSKGPAVKETEADFNDDIPF